MTLSWNEIKDRALKFSKEWANTSNEEADAKLNFQMQTKMGKLTKRYLLCELAFR
jgi:hypothetical protein